MKLKRRVFLLARLFRFYAERTTTRMKEYGVKKPRFSKSAKTYREQVDILKSRGLIVADEEKATNFLAYCNYYRFNGYVIPFESERDVFLPNIRFEQIRDLYEFDRTLRVLTQEGVSSVEVFFRTKIAYYIAHKYGSFGHFNFKKSIREKRDNAEDADDRCKSWEKWKNKIIAETERSKEEFIVAYQNKYSNFPKTPIWMSLEMCSFGALSVLFGIMRDNDKNAIAREIGMSGSVLGSWLHSLSVLRNHCAHYSRLWNRNFDVAPQIIHDKYLKKGSNAWNHCDEWKLFKTDNLNKRTFCLLTIVNSLLEAIKKRQGVDIRWRERVMEFLQNTPNVPNFKSSFGIPPEIDDWREMRLWKTKKRQPTHIKSPDAS